MFGIGKLKQELDQLRNDMAAEFVKRDNDIVATRTEVLKTRNAFDNALANLEKHLKDVEEYVSMQTDSIAAVILACGLREGNKFMDASEQIKREREKLSQMIAKARVKAEEETSLKPEAPKAEPALEAEETLFSGLDEYIDSAEARQMLGWKSLSTTMLRRMNIRYQQPKGRYHRLTVHKGDCEKFISNRIVRRKKN